ARKADACEPAFIEPLLKLPGTQPGLLFTAFDPGRVVRIDTGHVLRKPCPCPSGELFHRFRDFGPSRRRIRHDANSSSLVSAYTRRLWSSGVPNIERYSVALRRNRCRSCSHVTPMPPCNWMQSCTMLGACSPT